MVNEKTIISPHSLLYHHHLPLILSPPPAPLFLSLSLTVTLQTLDFFSFYTCKAPPLFSFSSFFSNTGRQTWPLITTQLGFSTVLYIFIGFCLVGTYSFSLGSGSGHSAPPWDGGSWFSISLWMIRVHE